MLGIRRDIFVDIEGEVILQWNIVYYWIQINFKGFENFNEMGVFLRK